MRSMTSMTLKDPWVKIPQRTVHLGTQCRHPPVLAEPAGVSAADAPGGLVLSVSLVLP